MEKILLSEIASAIGAQGKYTGMVDTISTDTRSLPHGCLFIALNGANFNGHDYILQAFAQGAAFAVAHERRDYGQYSDRVLLCGDTERALMAIGQLYRKKFPALCCIGVTGSVGKTTTKEMIAQVLSAQYHTLKTEGNLNNEIGLPKTLLQLTASHQVAVIEMGMEGLGEIAALAQVAQPQMGVITNVGVSHIERLGSREQILRAKLELAHALPDGATLLLCGDNDLLSKVSIPRLDVRFYGIENPDCDLRAKQIIERDTETFFQICFEGKTISAEIPCIGRHNVCNALAAFGVGYALGIAPQVCVAALKGYQPSGMRQRMVRWNGCTVVEDCYNASPDSMRAALQTLKNWRGASKKIVVLADMLELGKISQQAHFDVGVFAAENQIDLLLAYGEQAAAYVKGAQQAKLHAAYHFQTKAQMLEKLCQEQEPGCVIWVKGSRGMHLEELLKELYSKE